MNSTLFKARLTFNCLSNLLSSFYILRLYPLKPVSPYDTHYLIFPFGILKTIPITFLCVFSGLGHSLIS